MTTNTSEAVAAAHRHLGRTHIRKAILRNAAIVLGAAAVCALARPFLLPLHDGHVLKSALRAFALAGTGATVATLVLIVRAWRSRPSMLASARSLDDALGLKEVVASGYAFGQQEQAEANELKAIAITRAKSALEGVVIEKVFVPTKIERTQKEHRYLRGAAVALVACLSFGAIDRLLVERTIHPVTSREKSAADELKRAAEQLAAAHANDPKKNPAPKDPKAEALVDAARRASEAAKNGDRQRALDALEEMRSASRSMEAEERDQARSLRSLRDEVEAGGKAGAKGKSESERPGRPSASASEALAKLEKELDAAAKSKDPEELKKLAERLEKAEAAARSAADKAHESAKGRDGKAAKEASARESAWSRAAAALKEAREAAARGDTEGAKRAMERAEREIEAMEKEAKDPSRASAMAKMEGEASELDKSLHEGMSGGPSKDGKDKGEGGESESAGKGKGKGLGEGEGKSTSKDKETGDPSGKPGGGGPGDRDHATGPEQRRVKVNGNLQARTDVKEGERAVSAIDGMGRGGDPKAYKEIFPSYDSVVEDGLHEEVVPAARRPTVRRYFSSIRPSSGDDGTSSSSDKTDRK